MASTQTTERTLPDGTSVTVCASHDRVVCGDCCVDFSCDLNDGECISSDEEGIFGFEAGIPVPRNVSFAQAANSRFGCQPCLREGEAEPTTEPTLKNHIAQRLNSLRNEASPWSRVSHRTQISRNFFPTLFYHPEMNTQKPLELFPSRSPRFINRYNEHEMLAFVDGACSSNGNPDAVGGCGFVFKSGKDGSVGFRLEDHGIDGKAYRVTSNRAELRAALAVLKFRSWHGEGFKSLVIATDSAYVAQGATDWARGWMEKGWRSSKGEPVKNRDLWEALLLAVERLHEEGFRVSFWRIPREWNGEADRVAREAVTAGERQDGYRDIFGFVAV